MHNIATAASSPEEFNLSLGRALFSDPPRSRENAVLQANACDIVAGINAGDLVRIDFTETKLNEGLYVITLDDNWIGYRRFQRMPDLRMTGETEAIPVTPEILRSIKVVGKVKEIYRNIRN
jgi:hypothetical protein